MQKFIYQFEKFFYNFLLTLMLLSGLVGLYNLFFNWNDPNAGIYLVGSAFVMYLFYRAAEIFNPQRKKEVIDLQKQKVRKGKKLKVFVVLGLLFTIPSAIVLFRAFPPYDVFSYFSNILASLIVGAFLTLPIMTILSFALGLFERKKK